MKKCAAVAAVLMLTVSMVFAESIFSVPVEDAKEDNVFSRYDSAIGIGGYFNQAGIPCITYQHWLTPSFGFAVGGGAIYEPMFDNVADYEFAATVQLQKALYTASNQYLETRLYIWGMTGFDTKCDSYVNGPVKETNGSLAAGFGIDITSLNHISIPVEFGYCIQGPDSFTIRPTGSLGIRYRY